MQGVFVFCHFFRIPVGSMGKPLTFPGFAIGRGLLVLGAASYGYISYLPKTLITLLKIVCGGKFHRFLRSKMTAGLLAVKMGLRNVLGRFVATPESTAWDSYPLRGIRPHNAFGKKDFQSCFPKRLDSNFIYITGPQARFFRFPPLDRAFCGAFSPFQFHLVNIQAPMREVTGTVSTTPVVEAMDWASSMAR